VKFPTWPFHFRRVGTGLASVVGIFVCIVACLLLLSNVRSRVLSAVRAYVAGEGLYSKGQKDAVNHLVRYAQSHDDRDYRQYLETIAIPLGDRTARLELEKPNPDLQVVYDGFISANNHPEDVADMAMLFRRFRRVSYIDKAIGAWAAGDALIARLVALGDELHQNIASGRADPAKLRPLLAEVHALNAQLTLFEDEFSRTLGEGNRWLARRLAQLTYVATAFLLLTGVLLSWAIFRRVNEADDALRRGEERYRSLVSMTTAVVWTADSRGVVPTANPTWEAYTGQPPDEYVPTGWVAALHPDDRERVLEVWDRALRDPVPFQCDARIFHAATGRHRHCVAHAVPLLAADGTVREWIGTWTDVDERKSAEEALQAADRQKDQFMAMLAHELRNPLGPIRNAVHILRRVSGGAPQANEAYEIIDRQATYMARLLDDLLDVSRIARGKVELRNEVLDLCALVRGTSEDYRATMELAGVTLSVDVPRTPIWVYGDSTRLSQVLGNLLHNASKFTQGSARVAVALCERSGAAELVVRDTGIGMKPDQVEKMFDAFAQADHSLDRSRGGLGLGLALVKGLLDLHGGTVSAQSAGVGEGCTFQVTLPTVAAPARAETPELISPAVATRSLRVLVVEDNADLAGSMRRLLELDGHQPAVATTGVEAMEIARGFRPDVVLCDIGLPGGMNGYEVAEALRKDPELESVLLIALTGYGRPEDRRHVVEAGFDLHMIKPVDPVLLAHVLARRGERRADDAGSPV
jgi:PAS domain S-box-containing protein